MRQLIVIIMVAVAVISCKGPSEQRRAVDTLYSLHVTADKAYDYYLDRVIQGKIRTNSVPTVSAHYTLFQQAYNAAVARVAVDTNAPAPAEVLQTVIELEKAVKAAK